eukprot:6214827-Pleurochrysis_carterae.AAC.3
MLTEAQCKCLRAPTTSTMKLLHCTLAKAHGQAVFDGMSRVYGRSDLVLANPQRRGVQQPTQSRESPENANMCA